MTITQVRYVLEVASCLSISQAAERLYVSQSAISQQLRRLEQELGYELFQRRSHSLALTPEGARFCELAVPLAEEWSRFCETVAAQPAGKRRRLVIGLGARAFSNGLFPKIVSFFESHPELELSFVTDSGRDFLPALEQGKLDLALDILPAEDYLSDQEALAAFPLITERQCVLMAKEDPLADAPFLRYEDLEGATVISALENSSEARLLRESFRENGVTVSRIYRSDSIDTVMQLVKSGRGIVLGPASFAAYYDVAAVPLLPETFAALQFICPKGRAERREYRELRSCLLEAAKGVSQKTGSETESHELPQK